MRFQMLILVIVILIALEVLNRKSIFSLAGSATANGEVPPTEYPSASKVIQLDGVEWVEHFVREMMSSSNIDDARARASRALEVLEKSICARASAEAAQSFHQVGYCRRPFYITCFYCL